MVEAAMPLEDVTVQGELSRIGLFDRTDATAILMSDANGLVKHHTLGRIGSADPANYEALYVASGLFTSGGTTRNLDNLKRIIWMPFDFDLFDHQNVAPDERDDFRRQTQSDIDALVTDQRTEVEQRFADLGIPIHRLDYTGYGLAGYVYIDERDQTEIAAIRAWHRSIIDAVNTAAGIDLIDPKCSDTGTRVMRVPGSYNNKGDTPRLVRTLAYQPGETVRLSTDHAIPKLTPVDVPKAGAGLSAKSLDLVEAAMLTGWVDGQRHGIGVAYAGVLADKRVPELQALESVRRISERAGDKRPRDRAQGVTSTYKRLRAGATISGWSVLKRLLPAVSFTTVSQVLNHYADLQANVKAAGVRLDVNANGGQRRAKAEQPEWLVDDEWASMFPLVPEICYYGSFSDYRDIMAPTTEAPDVYHLAAALTWFGTLVGRQVSGWYASTRLYPNLYTVLIGASGRTRKNTAIERAIYLPIDRRPETTNGHIPSTDYAISRDVSSAEGFIKDLAQLPYQILYLDEFSIIQKNAQRKGTRTIFDKLIQAYDNPPFLSNRSKGDPATAKDPFVSMLAATQPRRLSDQMTSEDIHSGFANRLIYVIGAGKGRMSQPPDVDATAAWKLFQRWDEVIRSYRGGTRPILRLAPDAFDRWDAWYGSLENQKDRTEDESDMIVRLPVHAMKLALIYAISDGDDRIYDKHLEPAIAFVDWMWIVVRELIKGWGVGIDQQIELAIERSLHKHGPQSRRNLRDHTRNRRWGDREFAAVFQAMKANGAIVEGESGLIGIPVDEPTEKAS